MIRCDQRWDFWTTLAFRGTGPEGRVIHGLSGTRAPIQDQRERATSLLALLLVLAHGLAACVFDRQAKDTEPATDGPTISGKVFVSVDHVSRR